MYAIVLWDVDSTFSIVTLKSISEPRKPIADYAVGETVQAPFGGKRLDFKIYEIGDNKAELNRKLTQGFKLDLELLTYGEKDTALLKKQTDSVPVAVGMMQEVVCGAVILSATSALNVRTDPHSPNFKAGRLGNLTKQRDGHRNIVYVDFNHCRIAKIQNLEGCTKAEGLCLRQNLVSKIEGLSTLASLVELELYDNQITKIENLEALVNLEILDLSFNRITKLENLGTLTKVKKFYVINNKITKIENIDHMTQLEMLELGSNRIREIENISTLTNLTSLFVGKNKLTKLKGMETLVNLTTLSLQSNRFVKIEGLDTLVNLEELYLSDNGIEKIEGLEHNTKLNTLDLAQNRISKFENLGTLTELTEFWFNDNKVESWKELDELRVLTKLETIYLERNPIYYEPSGKLKMDANYRRKVILTLPWVKQLDATMAQAMM